MGVPYAEVIGDPVEHSKSPLIHSFWLQKLALNYEYRRTRISPGQLPAYLYKARKDPLWCGANVTIPLKRKITELLDELAYPASSIGAVNAVVTNTDSQSGTLTNGYTYVSPNPAPTVTVISPVSGPSGWPRLSRLLKSSGRGATPHARQRRKRLPRSNN